MSRHLWQSTAALAALLTVTACARPDMSQKGKVSDIFATPDWANISGPKVTAARAITAEDLMTADGRCAASPEAAAPASTDGAAPNAPETTTDALAGQGPLPQLSGGVALSMTECQVVQRTGYPDRFDISAEGTERIATMTVTRGPSPGLYRFRAGRLVSIERVDVPAPAKPAKAQKGKKAAQKAPAIRGSQQ